MTKSEEGGDQRDPFYTVPQAAEYLNVSVRYVRRLVAEKRIVSFKLGPGKGSPIRFRGSDLEEFIESGRRGVGHP